MLLGVLSRRKPASCHMLQSSRMPRQHAVVVALQVLGGQDLQPWLVILYGARATQSNCATAGAELMPTGVQLLPLLHLAAHHDCAATLALISSLCRLGADCAVQATRQLAAYVLLQVLSKFMPTSRRLVQFSDGKTAPANAKIVYIDGAFDLFHVGHIKVLQVRPAWII